MELILGGAELFCPVCKRMADYVDVHIHVSREPLSLNQQADVSLVYCS